MKGTRVCSQKEHESLSILMLIVPFLTSKAFRNKWNKGLETHAKFTQQAELSDKDCRF